jgi:Tfp pilus assembly protein FimV
MTVLMLFIVLVGVLPAAGDPVPPRPAATITVRVSQADTLWSIAAAHRLPGLSTTQMVRVIKEANALSFGALGAGDVLRVPAASTAEAAYAQVTTVRDTD